MDNLEYLQHISQSNRPLQPAKKSFPLGTVFKILLGATVITIVAVAITILINNASNRAGDLTRQLYTRINTTNQAISLYNSTIKSSKLRSIGYSLSSTLTSGSNQLSRYISVTYADQENPFYLNADIYSTEQAAATKLGTALKNARLNGLLDRVYATQIHLQVATLMSMTSELLARDPSQSLRNILDPFYSNLNTIEQTLDNFSNPNA